MTNSSGMSPEAQKWFLATVGCGGVFVAEQSLYVLVVGLRLPGRVFFAVHAMLLSAAIFGLWVYDEDRYWEAHAFNLAAASILMMTSVLVKWVEASSWHVYGFILGNLSVVARQNLLV